MLEAFFRHRPSQVKPPALSLFPLSPSECLCTCTRRRRVLTRPLPTPRRPHSLHTTTQHTNTIRHDQAGQGFKGPNDTHHKRHKDTRPHPTIPPCPPSRRFSQSGLCTCDAVGSPWGEPRESLGRLLHLGAHGPPVQVTAKHVRVRGVACARPRPRGRGGEEGTGRVSRLRYPSKDRFAPTRFPM